MTRYSRKDLIRKPITRLIIFSISLFCIIVGIRHWDYFHDWKGLVVLVLGIFLLGKLHLAYENLLEELDESL